MQIQLKKDKSRIFARAVGLLRPSRDYRARAGPNRTVPDLEAAASITIKRTLFIKFGRYPR